MNKKIKVIIFSIFILLTAYFGRSYYQKSLSRISTIQRTQIINISRRFKKGDTTSTFIAFALLFAYGVIHSIGPGHGKAIVSSIFFTNKSNYAMVVSLAAIISYMQGFSAYLTLKVINYIGIKLMPNNIQHIEGFARYFSAILIFLFSLYFLYKEIKGKKCSCEKKGKDPVIMAILLGLTPCS